MGYDSEKVAAQAQEDARAFREQWRLVEQERRAVTAERDELRAALASVLGTAAWIDEAVYAKAWAVLARREGTDDE